MECYNCGLKLPADADRCPRCGQRFKPRRGLGQMADRGHRLTLLSGRRGLQ